MRVSANLVKIIIIVALTAAAVAWEVSEMAHGARKWSNVGAEDLVYGSQDMAELAARLGSPVTHNREGNILFMETFESGMQPWLPNMGGAGADILLSNLNYRTSGYSCKMVAGSDGDRWAQISRHFPYPVLGRYGLESSVLVDGYLEYLIWTLSRYDGHLAHQFQITYSPGDQEFWVTVPGGSAVDVATDIKLDEDYGLFHTIKLVGDFVTGNYVRLIINNAEYDLSAFSEHTFAAETNPYVFVVLTVQSLEGVNATVFVDDIIVTQNEPP